MIFTVRVEADAEREWDEAVRWYEERVPGLGTRLNAAIRAVLHTFSKQPERFLRATGRTHKAKVPRPWPYSIYFTVNIEQHEVNVVAIWHGARNPAQLHGRLK